MLALSDVLSLTCPCHSPAFPLSKIFEGILEADAPVEKPTKCATGRHTVESSHDVTCDSSLQLSKSHLTIKLLQFAKPGRYRTGYRVRGLSSYGMTASSYHQGED